MPRHAELRDHVRRLEAAARLRGKAAISWDDETRRALAAAARHAQQQARRQARRRWIGGDR